MWIGDVVAGRFVVERPIGSGGMGSVFLATDRVAGGSVALKVLDLASDGAVERFRREARVLAELGHPGIVRYVAHGETDGRQPFLAMEILRGEDLAQRLSRGCLSVDESILLVRKVAGALAFAHARGVVHRDIKPSNLFLVDSDVESVKVLDFGIARTRFDDTILTQTGAMLGTVGYMAPEQAKGSSDIDARADVFAMGCILFECLTGRPAFGGVHAVAILAKVLAEESPRPSEFRTEVGIDLDSLVSKMLAKNPAERVQDATELLSRLDLIGSGAMNTSGRSLDSKTTRSLTHAEQKLVSVVLGETTQAAAVTRTATPAQALTEAHAIREVAERFGAKFTELRGGSMLFVLSGKGIASDQAMWAASCALAVHRLAPQLRLALATGSAETTDRVPVGPAIDRSASLLRSESPTSEPAILIDEVTAGLLPSRFDVLQVASRRVLIRERSDLDEPRLFMGRSTPCVGREKELALLDLTLRECIGDSVARAVLVTGPAGQGKSRLRHEFVVNARKRSDLAILTARAEGVSAGSAFMLVRQLVRQAMGLQEGGVAAEGNARIRARLAHLHKSSDVPRIADFLGELIGLPAVDRPSQHFRAARHDPQMMALWLERSFRDWLAAECSTSALLVIIEDLHWGDLPSVNYLGEALRELAGQPFMVLALARPGVHESFPALWPGAEVNEIVLGRLTARAAERMVRALVEHLSADSMTRIVQRANGNPFFLEELVRHVAEGFTETLPVTILALVGSRLESLEPDVRRIARAASVFGEVFWRDAVLGLTAASSSALDTHLQSLVASDVIVPAIGCRFVGQAEYRFRHSFFHEAAYAMLTDTDRSAGHRFAGEWLERAGDRDALTLAHHFELGGQGMRAVPWLVEAAQMALDGGNLPATITIGDRALKHGAQDGQRGTLGRMQAAALAQRGDLVAAASVGREAMGCLPVGSPEWLLCASNLFWTCAFLGDQSAAGPVLQAILSTSVPPEPTGPYGWAICSACAGLTAIGALDVALSLLAPAEAKERSTPDNDPAFVTGLRVARGYLLLASGGVGEALSCLLEARALADTIVHESARAASRLLLVAAYAETGCLDRAEATASELRSLAVAGGMRFYIDRSAAFLGSAKINAGRISEAKEQLLPLMEQQDRFLAAAARARIAHALIGAGEFESATTYAETALESGSDFPSTQAAAFGALALIQLRRGQPADALSVVEQGLAAGARAMFARDGSILHLARAEALYELGRRDDALTAIHEAVRRIQRISADIVDAELRQSYVADVLSNARTFDLAKEWAAESST